MRISYLDNIPGDNVEVLVVQHTDGSRSGLLTFATIGDTETQRQVDGSRATRKAAGTMAQFAANLSDAALAAYNAAFPNRIAIKHAHSQQNPEKDWGSDTLVAARYAFYVLNAKYGSKLG